MSTPPPQQHPARPGPALPTSRQVPGAAPEAAPAQASPLVVAVTDMHVTRMRDRFEDELRRHLGDGAVEVRYLASTGTGSVDDTLVARHAAELADTEVFVGPRIDAAMVQAMPRLRLIQVAGAGIDGVDLDSLPAQVQVANSGHHEDAMAEWALWAAIDLRRGLAEGDRLLREGIWATPAVDTTLPMRRGLAGARVGLLGFGRVGVRSWQAFAHFGARGAAVSGRGLIDSDQHGLDWAGDVSQTLRLCEWADILLVSAPLTDATRGLIGAAELAALGPDGILLNVARGPVVDESALDAALRDGVIAGAGIDVWYDYPGSGEGVAGAPHQPATRPLTRHAHTRLSPHISGVAQGTFDARVDDAAANVAALVTGGELLNRIR